MKYKYTNLRFVGASVLLLVGLMFQQVNYVSAQDGSGSETITATTFSDDSPVEDGLTAESTTYILNDNFDTSAINTTPVGSTITSSGTSQWGVTGYSPLFTPTTGAASSPTSAGNKVWVSAGGSSFLNPVIDTYPTGAYKTTMVYDLNLSSYNTSAALTFWYYNNSEDCTGSGTLGSNGDFFLWGAKLPADANYTGMMVAGFSGGWKQVTLDLSAYKGQPSVLVAFQFYTDGDANIGDGAYVDDVKLVATGSKVILARASQSGYLRESGFGTNVANLVKGGVYQLGDTTTKAAYRTILSFNTALPTGLVVQSAKLQVTYSAVSGNSFSGATKSLAPFNGSSIFMKKGFFGSTASLQFTDFNQSALNIGKFPNTPKSNVYTRILTATQAANNINTAGVTQFRLQFTKKTDSDAISDLMKFKAPKLVLTYGTP